MRTKTFLAEDAVNRLLDKNERQIESTLRGLNDIEAGKTTNIDDVIAEWSATIRPAN